VERGPSRDNVPAGDMFERYTERARRCLFFARHEADQLSAVAIAPNISSWGSSRTARTWSALPTALVRRSPGVGDTSRPTRHGARVQVREVPFAASTRQAREAAAATADRLAHRDIGVLHLRIALIELNHPIAAATLREVGMYDRRGRTGDARRTALHRDHTGTCRVAPRSRIGSRRSGWRFGNCARRVERLEQGARQDGPS
jgi:hypothetical protein